MQFTAPLGRHPKCALYLILKAVSGVLGVTPVFLMGGLSCLEMDFFVVQFLFQPPDGGLMKGACFVKVDK